MKINAFKCWKWQLKWFNYMIRSYSFQNPCAFSMACATFETTAQKTLGTLACRDIWWSSFRWNASLITNNVWRFNTSRQAKNPIGILSVTADQCGQFFSKPKGGFLSDERDRKLDCIRRRTDMKMFLQKAYVMLSHLFEYQWIVILCTISVRNRYNNWMWERLCVRVCASVCVL